VTHDEFAEAYRAGSIRVEIDRAAAARYMSGRLLLPLVMLPILGIGVALDWQIAKNFALKASAIYYKTDGMVDLQVQEGVPTSVTRPVPVTYFDDTKKTAITLKGIYDFSKSLSLTAGYAYEKYEYSDEQYNGYRNTIPASSLQDSYLSNLYANPQYKANIFFGLLTYRF
jgi:hypothetical protein